MSVVVWIVVASLVTLAFVTLVDRLPPAVSIVGFLVVAPLTVMFRSTGADQASVFSLLKMFAVSIGAAYVQGAKVTRLTEHPAGRAVGFAILAANILEAVAAEAAQGGWINAAAGLLLVCTQARPGTIYTATEGTRREYRYPLGALWVAAYVVWNFTFLYARDSHGVRGSYAALAVVHLGVPLVAMRGRSERFITFRALALTLAVGVRLVAPFPPFLMLSSGWYRPEVAGVLQGLSAALALAVAARAWRLRGAVSATA